MTGSAPDPDPAPERAKDLDSARQFTSLYNFDLMEGGLQLDCDHIFFALSQRPADDLGFQLGCERDDDS